MNPTIIAACRHWQISLEELRGDGRGRHIMPARVAVAYVLHYRDSVSMSRIGELMRRDHTTILHGLRMVEKWRERDERFVEFVNFHMALPKWNAAAKMQPAPPLKPSKPKFRPGGLREMLARGEIVPVRLAEPAPAPKPEPKPAPEVCGVGSLKFTLDEDGETPFEKNFKKMLRKGSERFAVALNKARRAAA